MEFLAITQQFEVQFVNLLSRVLWSMWCDIWCDMWCKMWCNHRVVTSAIQYLTMVFVIIHLSRSNWNAYDFYIRRSPLSKTETGRQKFSAILHSLTLNIRLYNWMRLGFSQCFRITYCMLFLLLVHGICLLGILNEE